MSDFFNYLMWCTEGSFWRFLGQLLLIATICSAIGAGIRFSALLILSAVRRD